MFTNARISRLAFGLLLLSALCVGSWIALCPKLQAIPSTDPASQVTTFNELYVKTNPMGTAWGTGEAEVQGNLLADANLTVLGTFAPTNVAPIAASTLVWTPSAVTITSPTVTFSVANKFYIALNSSANQTAVRPTNGTVGQVIHIRSGTVNTNTMRFDDSTSTSCGSNITLTGQQDDFVSWVCLTAGATGVNSTWACLSAHDN